MGARRFCRSDTEPAMNTQLEAIDQANTLREAASLLALLTHHALDEDADPLAPDVLARATYLTHELIELAAA